MAAERRQLPHRPTWLRAVPPKRPFRIFVASALLVLVAVAAGTVLVSGQIARSLAVDEAERTAERIANLLVLPLLRPALAGDEESWNELERDVANRMNDGSVVSVLVWTAEGEVLFATKPSLEGEQFEVSDELQAALDGETVANVDENPETNYGVGGPLLEVYVPIDAGQGPMAVETYLPTDSIEEQTSLIRNEIVPLAIGALVVLQLIQLPIAASMARRARRAESERIAIMARSIAASDRERRAIAGDVHDGPVQDLAGVSYALAALRPAVGEDRRATVDRLTATIRHAVASLRRLMVDIYPPDLSGPGLPTALDDLAQRLREAGIEVTVTAEPPPELPPEYVAVLYRTAKEALANVARHAGAQNAWVTLTRTRHGGSDAMMLTVADDGVGIGDGPGAGKGGEGHFGLRLVRERLLDLDGDVEVEPRAAGGTVLTAVLPVPRAE